MYNIKNCQPQELSEMMAFMDQHWSQGHVLATSLELMHWQYYNKWHDRYNFLVARGKDGRISGILGFIPNSHYAENINEESNILWLTMWRVRSDVEERGSGLKLLFKLYEVENTKRVATTGVSDEGLALYKALKFRTGVLDHFVLIHPEKIEFRLAQVPASTTCGKEQKRKSGFSGHPLSPAEFQSIFPALPAPPARIPLKTAAYYDARYFRHPFYAYHALGLFAPDGPRAVLIYRKACHGKDSALRTVDIVGDSSSLPLFRPELNALLRDSGAEFLDVYCWGTPEKDLLGAGFLRRSAVEGLIVPNYFEPFIRRNIEINFAWHPSLTQGIMAFKGDGDQDRPNLL